MLGYTVDDASGHPVCQVSPPPTRYGQPLVEVDEVARARARAISFVPDMARELHALLEWDKRMGEVPESAGPFPAERIRKLLKDAGVLP